MSIVKLKNKDQASSPSKRNSISKEPSIDGESSSPKQKMKSKFANKLQRPSVDIHPETLAEVTKKSRFAKAAEPGKEGKEEKPSSSLPAIKRKIKPLNIKEEK